MLRTRYRPAHRPLKASSLSPVFSIRNFRNYSAHSIRLDWAISPLHQRGDLASDHDFLVRCDNTYLDLTGGAADAIGAPQIGRFVKGNSEPGDPPANPGSHARCVLADAAGKHQAFEAAQRVRHTGNRTRNAEREEIDRFGRARIGACHEYAHVARNAGYSEQSRLSIKQVFHRRHVESASLLQVEQDARVDGAATRAHDDTVERSESHCRVNALAVTHRAKACPAA